MIKAKYYDGKSASYQEVTLSIGISELGLRTTAHTHEESFRHLWLYDSLHLLETPKSGFAYVIGSSDEPDARLELLDNTSFAKLKDHMPANSPSKHMKERGISKILGIATAAILLLCFIFWGVPKSAPYIVPIVPDEWQESLGEYVIKAISEDSKKCDNPKGIAALSKMVTRLSNAAKLSRPLQVSVISDTETNAFAAPGTHIVLLQGLISESETPDEVAGILAHEMGHVIEKHPMIGVIRVAGTGMIIQMMLGDISGFANIGMIANEVYQLRHSRKAELQADTHSLRILKAANISPQGMAAFFARIQKEEGEAIEGISKYMNPEILNMLSTHPDSTSREEYFKQSASSQTTPALNQQDWKDLKDICK